MTLLLPLALKITPPGVTIGNLNGPFSFFSTFFFPLAIYFPLRSKQESTVVLQGNHKVRRGEASYIDSKQ